MQQRVRFEGLDEILRVMNDPDTIRGPMTQYMERAAGEVQNRAQALAPVDTGRYRNSIRVETSGSTQVVVASEVEYAGVIEYGHRPGVRSDIDRLTTWAGRHGFDNPRGGAFAMARKFFREGREGLFVFRRALEGTVPQRRAALVQAAREILNKFRFRF